MVVPPHMGGARIVDIVGGVGAKPRVWGKRKSMLMNA